VSARVAALVLAGALATAPLAAQVSRFAGTDAGAYRVRFHSAWQGGGEALSGFAVGGQTRLVVGHVSLEASYAQGRLTADTGAAAARDLVDGSLALVVRPTHWLALKAGPHLRAYVAPGGTERWVLWEARARGESAIIPGVLQAHVEGWIAVASEVNVAPGAAGAHGGEAGLTLRLAQSPFWARLSYAVDRARMANDARTETVEAVFLGVGFGGR
jgi:hypothetical protein